MLLARVDVGSVVDVGSDADVVVTRVVSGGVGVVLGENVCVASRSDSRDDLTSLDKAASNTDSAFVVVGCSGRFVTAAEAPSPIAATRASMPSRSTLSSTTAFVGRASVLAMGPGPGSLLRPRPMFDICRSLL